jgi:PAS domain S-box-containing protein
MAAGHIRRPALKVVLVYAGFAMLWIVFSDRAVVSLFRDPTELATVNSLKGGIFVVVTAGLLYALLQGWGEAMVEAGAVWGSGPSGARRSGPLPILLAMMLLMPAVGFVFVRLQTPEVEREAEVSLQAIALLKAEAIENWLKERDRDGLDVQASASLAALVRRIVQDTGSTPEARLGATVQDWIKRRSMRDTFDGLSLVDDGGRLRAGEALVPGVPGAGLALAALAIASGEIQRGDLYRAGGGPAQMQWAVPIRAPGGGHVIAALVLRATFDLYLDKMIRRWPTASASAESLLVRRDGDSVLFLNALRHRPDAALSLRLPLSQVTVASRAVQTAEPGLARAPDYRGVEVLAAHRPVAGTDWFLVAKVDRDEVMAPVWTSLYGIGLVGLAATVGIMLALLAAWRQQQRAQRLELLAQQGQADRLISTLADNSSDAIFVKDLAGRYLMLNREALRVLGLGAGQGLGQDDAALMPPALAAAIRANDLRVTADDTTYTYEETVQSVAGERIFLATKGPLHDDAGQVVALFGISRDITERHRQAQALAAQSAALQQRNEELERFNRATVGRELDMIALKRQINELSRRLGRVPPFSAVDADAAALPSPADADGGG